MRFTLPVGSLLAAHQARFLLKTLVLTIAYVSTARVGFIFAIEPGNVTAVWPPSGIALAAAIAYRYSAYPGIWLGALLTNSWFFIHTHSLSLLPAVITASVIATGSTLQAHWAGSFYRHSIGPRFPEHLRRILSALGSMLVYSMLAAVVGTCSLIAMSIISRPSALPVLMTWWIGELAGMLAVTPALLFVCQWRANSLRPARFAFPLMGVGVGLTLMVVHAMILVQEQVTRDKFVRAADDVAVSLRRTIALCLQQLEATASFYTARDMVTRDEFRRFTRQFLSANKNIQALSWNPWVSVEQRPVYEQAARQDGYPDFRFTERVAGKLVPAAPRAEYAPVYFIEPLANNVPALGYDLASEPSRREALQQVRKTGKAATTRPIRLIQEQGEQQGVLIFWPITGKDSTLISGTASGVFRIGNLVESALNYLRPTGLEVYLFDPAAPQAQQLLYQPTRVAEQLDLPALTTGIHHQVAIEIPGRSWTLLFRPGTTYSWPGIGLTHSVTLLVGLLLTLFLGTYLNYYIATQKRMRIAARRLTRKINEQSRTNAALQAEIVERQRVETMLYQQAIHDSLTGLVNRQEFERRLEMMLMHAREQQLEHALCYLDLDQFKIVNDTCGHRAGDELLRQLTLLLRSRLRERDTLARLGGDEFGLILGECPLDQAIRIANQLRETVQDFRFVWQNKSFCIGVSIGLIPVTSHSDNFQSLLSAADDACYAAKERGRNRVHVYRPGDHELAQRQLEMHWVTRLHQLLADNRFCLYYQPILALARDAENSHGEILLRLNDTSGKLLLPGTFLPAAERYQQMVSIDRWVIRATLMIMQNHASAGVVKLPGCAINISGQSLSNESFLRFVLDELELSGVDPERICFEITETAAIANLSAALHFISKLKDRGCRFALDDFGSGLSSFAYLKTLPVDYLKIDGRFVRDIIKEPVDNAMVESIYRIGTLMGIKIIAESVEDHPTLERLRHIGIDYVQGFGIAKPEMFTDPAGTAQQYA